MRPPEDTMGNASSMTGVWPETAYKVITGVAMSKKGHLRNTSPTSLFEGDVAGIKEA